MNFRKREREASEVETGALADILFFLLMFFDDIYAGIAGCDPLVIAQSGFNQSYASGR